MPGRPPMTLAEVDALGRTVRLDSPPLRIVSAVPSLTELVFAWGAGDRVVGRTTFCVEPSGVVDAVPRVGGTKNLKTDRIVDLSPDLVIASVEENTKADVEALASAGLRVFLTLPTTVREAIDMLGTLGRLLGLEQAASDLARQTESVLAEVRGGPRATAFCPIWRNPYMTCAPGTYMHDLLSAAGLVNVFADSRERYPEASLEDVAARDPQVILLPDEPFPFAEKHLADFEPWRPQMRAFRRGQVRFIDGKLVSWYGPRMPGALHELMWVAREAAEATS